MPPSSKTTASIGSTVPFLTGLDSLLQRLPCHLALARVTSRIDGGASFRAGSRSLLTKAGMAFGDLANSSPQSERSMTIHGIVGHLPPRSVSNDESRAPARARRSRVDTGVSPVPFLTLVREARIEQIGRRRHDASRKIMNTQLLIDAVVQQTVVFIAQLATSGGIRAPLAHIANEVFLGLTRELTNQGIKKKVIADMFGVALRTYHRRVRELADSRTEVGQTLWEAVLSHIRDHEPTTGAEVQRRFRNDDPEVLSGVLNDLVASGIAYRAGRGDLSVYRLVDEADFARAGASRDEAHRHLVWLYVYRHGPIDLNALSRATRLDDAICEQALTALRNAGRIEVTMEGDTTLYRADSFEVPLGTTQGWEVAVLDHFQAMVTAITRKLAHGAAASSERDLVGGSTFSLDVWPGDPLEAEALGTLAKVRSLVEDLRARIDAQNSGRHETSGRRRVVVYVGQYVDLDERSAAEEE